MTTTSTDAKQGNGLPPELAVLKLFADSQLVEVGPSDAARLTGGNKGSLSPRLKAMAEAGFLAPTAGGRYTLGPLLPALAIKFQCQLLSQADKAQQMLSQFAAPLRQLVSLVREEEQS